MSPRNLYSNTSFSFSFYSVRLISVFFIGPTNNCLPECFECTIMSRKIQIINLCAQFGSKPLQSRKLGLMRWKSGEKTIAFRYYRLPQDHPMSLQCVAHYIAHDLRSKSYYKTLFQVYSTNTALFNPLNPG